MLSRVADSIFWMSRYIERAENVARFIDVNWHLLLDSGNTEQAQWQPLVDTTGDREVFMERYGETTRNNVIRFLSFDQENPNSILSCVRAARENARTIRDVISSEMWEQINAFNLMLKDAALNTKAIESPYEFFNEVKMASHLFLGVTDTTMWRGEGWNFFRLGQLLERCDKTSRILDVKYYLLNPSGSDSNTDTIQWAAVLKSASGLEMYRKRHSRIVPDRVVEFLMFEPSFPRAAIYCVKTANESLHQITGTSMDRASCDAEIRMNEIWKEIAATSAQDAILDGLHQYIDALQTKLNLVGTAIRNDFFLSNDQQTIAEKQAQSQSTTANGSQSQSQG
jgi:uncharacterized alpha-E superfamily protein